MKLCDTSVLVDVDRGGVDERVARLDDEGTHAISVVTVTELRLGVQTRYADDEEQLLTAGTELERLLARFNVHDVSRPIAIAAAEIISDLKRNGEPLHDLHDVYIGATAKTEQIPVLTANVDHFERIDGVTVVDWHTY